MTEMTLAQAVDRAREVERDNPAKSLNILRSLYQQVPTKDLAELYATTLCRVGMRDNDGLDRLIKRHPASGVLKAARSEMALCDGDYGLGFKWSKYRWSVAKGVSITSQVPCQEWDGKPFGGDLIVIGEQGLGEEIMYSSTLTKYAGRCVVSADQRLHPLLSRSFPQHIFAHKSTVRHFAHPDARKVEAMEFCGQCLPYGNHLPWLVADSDKTKILRDAISEAQPGKAIVGVSWYSSRKGIGEDKSIPAEAMLPLLTDPRIAAVNLQYGYIDDDAKYWQTNGGTLNVVMGLDCTTDLDTLASLVMACDVVVTCSNTTAHLAGALGKRTILIAPASRFVLWFWGTGDRTAWYPSVEIIRAKEGWEKAVREAICAITM